MIENLGADMLAEYPMNTALLSFKDKDGSPKNWVIGASERDTVDSLKAHLEKHEPGAELIGYALKVRINGHGKPR